MGDAARVGMLGLDTQADDKGPVVILAIEERPVQPGAVIEQRAVEVRVIIIIVGAAIIRIATGAIGVGILAIIAVTAVVIRAAIVAVVITPRAIAGRRAVRRRAIAVRLRAGTRGGRSSSRSAPSWRCSRSRY